ncbi:MAG: hypothetical protein KZQ60_05485, partial [Candidatus Thiodiazotropha sp. (ex Lucinoma aequizonata)]|nr:hypothetical protein [Candidatus Thiodiazotropha sp. (ex Lucinoma aequizonata)]MCU7888587.1 hypothetical protein [Candidatus Thiodiazotropha sp. (ex Lucinoma aequizonata)]
MCITLYTQNLTLQADWTGILVLGDERIFHFVSAAKNTVVLVIIQLKNWKKCLTRFFCIFSDFKEDCLPS